MRKISLAIMLAAAVFAAHAQDDNISLEGSGKIITKNVGVNSFNAIQVKGIYELVLTQGSQEGVRLEADDNLMHLFEVRNDGNTLVISMPLLEGKNHHVNLNGGNHKKGQHLKAYITFKTLKNLDAALIGSISSGAALKLDAFELNSKNVGNITLAFTATKLTLDNKGVGNITLSGSVPDAVVVNAGVGSIKAEGLEVQNMKIDNTGVGSATVNVAKDLRVKDSFLGKVKNTGVGKSRKMDGEEI